MKRFIIKTVEELDKFLKHFNTKVFAFDTETTSLKYKELQIEGLSLSDGVLSCYVFIADYNKDIINKQREGLLGVLSSLFNNAETIIAHNIVFDLKVLYKIGILREAEPELYCTMVAQHLINENEPSIGLKELSEKYLSKTTEKWKDIKDHSSREFFIYACHDAEWTYELMLRQIGELKEQGLEKLFRTIEMPFQWVLRDMEINGMLVDRDQIKATSKDIQLAIEQMEIDLLNQLGEPYTMEMTLDGRALPRSSINFNSSKQLSEILYKKLKLPILETTPGGEPSCSSKVLVGLRKDSQFVDTLIKYKKAQKLLTAYFSDDAQILSNTDEDGRVRPQFRDTGTTTGRLSCNQPNLQQLPKVNEDFPIDTRKVFIAPKGYNIITCDYSGQELRVLTEISKDPILIDTFIKGKDMHLSTANDFFELGIPESALYEGSSEHEAYKDKFKSERNKSKTINFGMAYGKGAYGFSKDFGVSEEEAQKILDKYFATLPEVKKAINRSHTMVRERGFLESMTGRRRRFSKVTKNGWSYYPNGVFRQAFNFLIQGYSADMMRMAMVAVRELSKKHPEWDLRPIATVHDEAVYEVKEAFTDVSKESIQKAFEEVATFCVPIVAETGVGSNYSEAK